MERSTDALALEAFVAEHHRSWRSSDMDLKTHKDGTMVRVLWPTCDASITVQKGTI